MFLSLCEVTDWGNLDTISHRGQLTVLAFDPRESHLGIPHLSFSIVFDKNRLGLLNRERRLAVLVVASVGFFLVPFFSIVSGFPARVNSRITHPLKEGVPVGGGSENQSWVDPGGHSPPRYLPSSSTCF